MMHLSPRHSSPVPTRAIEVPQRSRKRRSLVNGNDDQPAIVVEIVLGDKDGVPVEPNLRVVRSRTIPEKVRDMEGLESEQWVPVVGDRQVQSAPQSRLHYPER